MPIQLIVGLRNPGPSYQSTRHNAGAWFVEALVKHSGATLKLESKFHAEVALCNWNGHAFRVLLPTTFMNHSGRAVKSICQFYKIPIDEVLVAHDELDLPAGRVKIKTGGGHGGHNGLRDIQAQMGSSAFHRLRIGIGHPGHKDLVTSFVLGKPTMQDKQLIQDAVERSMAVMPELLEQSISLAMNKLNG